MVVKQLVQHGNSKAIVIDKAVLQAAGLDENALFQIIADSNTGITIQSVKPLNDDLFRSSLKKVMKKHGKLFKKTSRSMKFLTVEEVIEAHTMMVQLYGGLDGIRDMGLLISAIEMPKAMMFGEYLHATIFDKAAAYLFHIVCNHPFLDGNKRTGTAAALIFLDMNLIEMKFDEKELEELVVRVAQGKCDKSEISQFFENSVIK